MSHSTLRRQFLLQAAGLPAVYAFSDEIKRVPGVKLKLALNAYSFNKPLMAGTMTLADVIDYCAKHEVDGVDLTGYYFPGYPKVPADDYVYDLKKKAYLNGVTISGTGVRNDFTLPDPAKRKGEVQLVKDWIDVAQKMGAAFIRVFSGKETPAGYSFDQVLEWMVPAFQECARYGRERGVIVALQQHNDFLTTAAQTIRVVKAVNSEWFSVVLDVGSLRQGDPYEEIEKVLPYACTWQIKEQVWYGTKAAPIDLAKVKALIERHGYRGFLPFEALGNGDPAVVVTNFLERLRKAIG